MFLCELFEAYESTLTDLKGGIKEKEFTRKINILNTFCKGRANFYLFFLMIFRSINTIKH